MAPYERIVDEIRRRIGAGELRPGDRVPSARQITQEWGVAIATATKVLAALRTEGLVRPVVGVGTVVAEPAAAARQERPHRTIRETELTRERIVRTAIGVADAEGLAAVTMRRLGTELGVAVMSLYRHVPAKEDLVLLMADHVFGEERLPDPPPSGWRTQLETLARLQWQLCRRHTWLPGVMSLSRPMLAPNGMAHTEWTMRAVHGLGFDIATALHVTVTVSGFVIGIAASLQMDTEAEQETGLTADEWMEKQGPDFDDIVAGGRYPLLAAVAAQPNFDLELDTVFELGLSLLMDGFARLVESRENGR
jgi:DNA-binding transcriptional regulator YhcF (GntR family)